MFFETVRKNSRKNRKENGLLFVSLIVSIAAFYIILSLENQDVMVFLKKMESDAVQKLLLLIPVLYGISLFFLFFLVYFSDRYRMEQRSHEMGIYLMFGMGRRKLFAMLLAEDIWNSILSLAAGIPIAVLLSELISMITAKAAGMGIVGHRFTFSLSAALWTAAGYFAVRLTALLFQSIKTVRKEITQLLSQSQDKRHRDHRTCFTAIQLAAGFFMLAAAYLRALKVNAWRSPGEMAVIMVLGIGGTFLIFRGIGIVFDMYLKQKDSNKGLAVFTFRQIQETIVLRPVSIAVSSMLMLAAFCCFGYGCAIGVNSGLNNRHVIDYTFEGEPGQIKRELKQLNLDEFTEESFQVKTGPFKGNKSEGTFSGAELYEAVKAQEDSQGREVLLNNLQYFDEPYLISLSGYNRILKLKGDEPLRLKSRQAALYTSREYSNGDIDRTMKSALKTRPAVEMNHERYELSKTYCQENIVTDRSITISYGLVVPDPVFEQLTEGQFHSYWNIKLKDSVVRKKGLMQTMTDINTRLDKTSLKYESYLKSMGRQLFYTAAASYTTIYLGVIFLLIANTVLGVQFLMHQQQTKKRYRTILRLGCRCKYLCESARRQIRWFFLLPISAAAFGSLFGIRSMASGFAASDMRGREGILTASAVPVILLVCVIELGYIVAVMKMSDKQILRQTKLKRDDG